MIEDGTDEAVSLALHDTAAFILQMIRIFAPVDTGFLRDSYKKESVALLHILIGTMVNYAIHQEFGTSKQPGKPHVVPAFNLSKTFFRLRLVERMNDLG